MIKIIPERVIKSKQNELKKQLILSLEQVRTLCDSAKDLSQISSKNDAINLALESLKKAIKLKRIEIRQEKPVKVTIRAVDKRFSINIKQPIEYNQYDPARFKKILTSLRSVRTLIASQRSQRRSMLSIMRTFQVAARNSSRSLTHTRKLIGVKGVTPLHDENSKLTLLTKKTFTSKATGRTYELMLHNGVYETTGTYLELMKIKEANMIYEVKIPKTSENHVGVEIELVSKLADEKLCLELTKAGLARYVNRTSDGSIRTTDGYPYAHELRVLAPQPKIVEVLTKLCEVLNANSICTTNKSCGLHVHLDMRNRNKEIAFFNLVKAQGVLYKMVAPHRETDSYCKMTTDDNFKSYEGGNGNRYLGVNPISFFKHKTIEIRLHHGSVDAYEIVNWVKLLCQIADTPEKIEPTTTFTGFLKQFNINTELGAYIKDRILKYQKKQTKKEE